MENLWPDAFPTLKNLTVGEILLVWDSVSGCIRQHLVQDRGVQLIGIGTFYILKDYRCTVNSEESVVRRPMFHMSQVVADECNLNCTKEEVPADVTVVPLKCEELSVCAQMPFTMVQCCVYEIVTLFFRATSKRQDTDFVFNTIGILSVRNREVTMRFFDEFLLAVDDTGKLLKALRSTLGRRHLVVPRGGNPEFQVGPGGVFVLPQFSLTLPVDKEAVKYPAAESMKARRERMEKEREKKKKEEEGDKQIEVVIEDGDKEEEEKEEKEEEDKQIESDESSSAEHLLSRRRSKSSGPKKGKGQKGKRRRSRSSFLPTIQESSLVGEQDYKDKQTLGDSQTTLAGSRRDKKTSQQCQEASLQAGWSPDTWTELWPHSSLPPTGEEEGAASYLQRAWMERQQGLSRQTNLSLGNLDSRTCPRHKELELLSSGNFSVRANYTLKLLETYHMRREEWSRRVEQNQQRNHKEKQLFCIGQQIPLQDPRERCPDSWQNQRHRDTTMTPVNVILISPKHGKPPPLPLFYLPIKSCLHLSSGWLHLLFQAGVLSQDGLWVLCTFPGDTGDSGGCRLCRDAHGGSGTQQKADGVKGETTWEPSGSGRAWGDQSSPTASPVERVEGWEGGRGGDMEQGALPRIVSHSTSAEPNLCQGHKQQKQLWYHQSTLWKEGNWEVLVLLCSVTNIKVVFEHGDEEHRTLSHGPHLGTGLGHRVAPTQSTGDHLDVPV
ncbi:uncharacterized protein [Heliangelus exortis]|uniref:uncharacterized protein isoform X2 n=1 Tax=Heliangelus exortis TaxID=472823 RepID=UPI003A932A88